MAAGIVRLFDPPDRQTDFSALVGTFGAEAAVVSVVLAALKAIPGGSPGVKADRWARRRVGSDVWVEEAADTSPLPRA
jgi:hypothetical protein